MEKGHKNHFLEVFPYFVKGGRYFVHYTCNSPSKKVLDRNNIIPLGESFGCVNENEMLQIPLEVYKKAGFEETSKKEILTLNLERLIKNLK